MTREIAMKRRFDIGQNVVIFGDQRKIIAIGPVTRVTVIDKQNHYEIDYDTTTLYPEKAVSDIEALYFQR